MILHNAISDEILRNKIHHKEIVIGGNIKLKIYGKLACKSGKKLNRTNRIFFSSIQEAITAGYRPCGHCLSAEYKKWKNELI